MLYLWKVLRDSLTILEKLVTKNTCKKIILYEIIWLLLMDSVWKSKIPSQNI